MEHLSAYADGELSGTDKRQMEAHLLSCENCAELLKLYRKASNAEEMSNVPVPTSLVNNVMEQVHNDGARFEKNSNRFTRSQSALRRYAPIAACLLVVLLAIPFALPHIFAGDDDAAPAPMAELVAAAPADMPVAEDATADFFFNEQLETAPAPIAAFDSYDEAFAEFEEDGYYAEIRIAEPESGGGFYGEHEHFGAGIFAIDDDGNYLYIVDGAGNRYRGFMPDSVVFDFDDSNVIPFFTTIALSGELPEILRQYTPLEFESQNADYTLFIVSSETAETLISEMSHLHNFSFTPIYENGTYALVFHTP